MTFDDLINDVVVECAGAPDPLVIKAICESALRFCRESTALRKKLTPADLSYASGVYTITVPAGTQIESVLSPLVWYDVDGKRGVDIQGAAPEWLDKRYPGWRFAKSETDVAYFVMQSKNSFVLTPDNDADRSADLSVSVVLLPERNATTLDDELGERWFYELSAGAKATLMLMSMTPWANPDLGQFNAAKFEVGIKEAKRYAETGFRHPHADGVGHVKSYF